MNSTHITFTNSIDWICRCICVGHSMGGALAAISALDLAIHTKQLREKVPLGVPIPAVYAVGVASAIPGGPVGWVVGGPGRVESSESAGRLLCWESKWRGLGDGFRDGSGSIFLYSMWQNDTKISKMHRRMSWHVMAHQLKWGMLQMFAKNLTMKSWSCKKYLGCCRCLFKCLPMPCMGLGWYMVPLFQRNPFKDTLRHRFLQGKIRNHPIASFNM